MRPLQPLTLPSIQPLFTSAAAGCATQMGLCSAMKWAWLACVQVRCILCMLCMYFWCTVFAGEGVENFCDVFLLRFIWKSPWDKLVWFYIPVCRTEGRSAVWLCQSLAAPLKDNKDNIDACKLSQFSVCLHAVSIVEEIRVCFLLFRRNSLILFHAATTTAFKFPELDNLS